MRLRYLVALSAVAVLAIAACGSSGAPPAGATPTRAPGIGAAATPTAAAPAPTTAPVGNTVDVCTLLTGAEVKAATGKNYGEGYASPNVANQCSWNTNGLTTNRGDVIGAYIDPQAYSFLHSVMGIQTGVIELTVGGHAAFYNPLEGYHALWVDIGGAGTFILGFSGSGDLDPSYQAIAVQLAEIAVGRI